MISMDTVGKIAVGQGDLGDVALVTSQLGIGWATDLVTEADLLLTDLSAWGFLGGGGYRPTQWGARKSQAELAMIKTNIDGLFFDAVFTTGTDHESEITEHPVQNGANITDHVVIRPVTVTMEIGMSDVMASMLQGQWSGAYTKSVSAYRKLVSLMESKTPFTILTRLNRYSNMLIRSISVEDTPDTLYGLRATVSMQQILVAQVTTDTVSARKWTSGGTATKGEVQPKQTPTSIAKSIEDAAGG